MKTRIGRPTDMRYINISSFVSGGLSNQLYLMVGSLVWCIQNKVPALIVGKFLLQINTAYYTHIGKILYLPAINEYLIKKYNVYIIDEAITRFAPKTLQLYEIFPTMSTCSDAMNSDLGKDIMNNLMFTPNLVSLPMRFINNVMDENGHEKVNIIHLRVEDDAIVHWSGINNMTPTHFRKVLTDTYIEKISKHIPSDEAIILLSGSVDNEVTAFLRKHSYRYTMFTKQSKYREVNAIMDMIIGKMCNGVFIGAGGSTFSQLVSNMLERDVGTTRIMLNLNKIV